MRIFGIETGIMSVTAPGTTIYAKDIKREENWLADAMSFLQR
jgi:hypothetical protein